jgi:hypothetical protein
MKHLGFLLIVAFILALAGGGCRSTKVIRKAMGQRKDTTQLQSSTDSGKTAPLSAVDLHVDSLKVIRQALSGLAAHHIDFKTFSGRAKVNYERGDGDSYDLTANIRILKDSMIWISVSAVLGIEEIRMLITHDSVRILEKQGHVYRLRSVSYLQQEIHLPLDFASLQDLLIGNPAYLDTSNVLFYRKEQGGLSLLAIGSLFKNFITLDLRDNSLLHSKLDIVDPQQVLGGDFTFGDYEQKGGGGVRFSTYRKISIAWKSNLAIELNFKQYSFNEDLSFPFSVQKNYKRK